MGSAHPLPSVNAAKQSPSPACPTPLTLIARSQGRPPNLFPTRHHESTSLHSETQTARSPVYTSLSCRCASAHICASRLCLYPCHGREQHPGAGLRPQPSPSREEPISGPVVTSPNHSPFLSDVHLLALWGFKKHLARCFTSAVTRTMLKVGDRKPEIPTGRLGQKLSVGSQVPEP